MSGNSWGILIYFLVVNPDGVNFLVLWGHYVVPVHKGRGFFTSVCGFVCKDYSFQGFACIQGRKELNFCQN